MTLLRLGYLVHSFGNCAMTLLTEIGLITHSVHNMQLLVYEQTFFLLRLAGSYRQ